MKIKQTSKQTNQKGGKSKNKETKRNGKPKTKQTNQERSKRINKQTKKQTKI